MNYLNLPQKLKAVESVYSSRHVFNYYVARQFANTIANSAPKVKFENQELTKLWEKDKATNKFLKLNYEVVRLSSLYGSVFVGIVPTKTSTSDTYMPYFSVGIPLDYEYVGSELTKLTIVVDIFKHNSVPFFVIEEWDINKRFFKRDTVDADGNGVNGVNSSSQLNNANTWSPLFKTIPYVQFYANPAGKSDLSDVPDDWFKQFDLNMKILRTDSIINKGLLVANLYNNYNGANMSKLAIALQDPDQVVTDYTGVGSYLGDQAFNVLQGNSNGADIIAKLRFLEELIKKIGFVRTDTQNMGTKNTIASEVESINADADDYLEMKANLLEESWTSFFNDVYAPFCVNMDFINMNLDDVQVDVQVSGSTKYLQDSSNKYVQNQLGTLTNPNDLNQSHSPNENKLPSENKIHDQQHN